MIKTKKFIKYKKKTKKYILKGGGYLDDSKSYYDFLLNFSKDMYNEQEDPTKYEDIVKALGIDEDSTSKFYTDINKKENKTHFVYPILHGRINDCCSYDKAETIPPNCAICITTLINTTGIDTETPGYEGLTKLIKTISKNVTLENKIKKYLSLLSSIKNIQINPKLAPSNKQLLYYNCFLNAIWYFPGQKIAPHSVTDTDCEILSYTSKDISYKKYNIGEHRCSLVKFINMYKQKYYTEDNNIIFFFNICRNIDREKENNKITLCMKRELILYYINFILIKNSYKVLSKDTTSLIIITNESNAITNIKDYTSYDISNSSISFCSSVASDRWSYISKNTYGTGVYNKPNYIYSRINIFLKKLYEDILIRSYEVLKTFNYNDLYYFCSLSFNKQIKFTEFLKTKLNDEKYSVFILVVGEILHNKYYKVYNKFLVEEEEKISENKFIFNISKFLDYQNINYYLSKIILPDTKNTKRIDNFNNCLGLIKSIYKNDKKNLISYRDPTDNITYLEPYNIISCMANITPKIKTNIENIIIINNIYISFILDYIGEYINLNILALIFRYGIIKSHPELDLSKNNHIKTVIIHNMNITTLKFNKNIEMDFLEVDNIENYKSNLNINFTSLFNIKKVKLYNVNLNNDGGDQPPIIPLKDLYLEECIFNNNIKFSNLNKLTLRYCEIDNLTINIDLVMNVKLIDMKVKNINCENIGDIYLENCCFLKRKNICRLSEIFNNDKNLLRNNLIFDSCNLDETFIMDLELNKNTNITINNSILLNKIIIEKKCKINKLEITNCPKLTKIDGLLYRSPLLKRKLNTLEIRKCPNLQYNQRWELL